MDELCPDGVEYKALEKLTTKIVDGSHKVPPKSSNDDALPMISAQNIINGKLDTSFGRYIDPSSYTEESLRTRAQRDDVLLTIVGAIGRTAMVETDDVLAFQRSVCVITVDESCLDPRFLRHVLDSSAIQNHMETNARGAAQKGFYLSQVAELSIPVPPIEVQHEIVRILDSFQELDDALTAEIEARQKQLSHYVDVQICGASVSFTGKLNDICKLIADCPHSTAPDEGEGIPLIRTPNISPGYLDLSGVHRVSEDVYRQRISRAVPQKDDLILAREGTAGNVAIIPDKTTVCLGQRTVLLRPDPSQVLPLFLCFYMNSDTARAALLGQAAGSTVSHINLSDIRSFTVRIPDMSMQETLVERFSKLQDYLFCLRNENRLRRKQFEYYRDRLLSFPEKVES